jgi:hypothetical protein
MRAIAASAKLLRAAAGIFACAPSAGECWTRGSAHPVRPGSCWNRLWPSRGLTRRRQRRRARRRTSQSGTTVPRGPSRSPTRRERREGPGARDTSAERSSLADGTQVQRHCARPGRPRLRKDSRITLHRVFRLRSPVNGPSPRWGEGRVRGALRKYRSARSNRDPHPHPLPRRERELRRTELQRQRTSARRPSATSARKPQRPAEPGVCAGHAPSGRLGSTRSGGEVTGAPALDHPDAAQPADDELHREGEL